MPQSLIIRLLRKVRKTYREFGAKELARRMWIFLERGFHKNKYFHRQLSNTPKEVLFIAGEPMNATTYYRCEIPALQLETQGWNSDIVYEDFVEQVNPANYKYLIFYRTPLNKTNQKLLDKARKLNKKILFSVDDLVYREDILLTLDYTSYLDKDDATRLIDRAKGMQDLMKLVDAGIASTNHLSSDMSNYIEGRVFVNRNGIKHQWNLPNKSESKDVVMVGYFSGSDTHDRDMGMIWPVLTKLFEKYKNLRLVVGGRINFNFGKYKNKVERMPFISREKFMQKLSHIDINLLPLEDTEFNRGKSEIKFLEAAQVKVPTIVSAVGDMDSEFPSDIIAQAKDTRDWERQLSTLIENSEYRKIMGEKAYDYVYENYAPEKLGKELVQFLSSL